MDQPSEQSKTPCLCGRNPQPALSPPIVKKNTLTIPYTTNSRVRDDSLIAIGIELSKHIVGPMPAKEFLDILPKRVGFNRLWKKHLQALEQEIAKITNATTEYAMYEPFIDAMGPYCPKMTGCDTSDNAIISLCEGTIKPDFMFYHKIAVVPGTTDLLTVEIIGEAKFDPNDDPFIDEADEPIGRGSARAVQTMGLVESYTIAQLGSQFRTHVFSFLLFRDFIRLMRWDRAGVVVSERIPLTSPDLAEFFWRYNHATPSQRGVDTTVKPFHATQDLTKDDLFERLQFAEDNKSLTANDINFFEMTIPDSGKSYIVGKPVYSGGQDYLVSRATRTFKAWCVTTRKPVFLKDTWRFLSCLQRPEHEVYEKLLKTGVSFVPTVLDSGDILKQYTKTASYAKKPWAKKVEANERSMSSVRTLQHYRLVLKEIGRSLTTFKTLPEALTAMANALQAHREAHYKARVLHRDISVGNIIIYNGGGLLIDWEVALDLDADPGPSHLAQVGTWAFQSLELQKTTAVPHKRYHDHESFYHVLTWLSLTHARHALSGPQLAEILRLQFEEAVEGEDGRPIASFIKKCHMIAMDDTLTSEAKFRNAPLVRLLRHLRSVFRALYDVPEEPIKGSDDDNLFYEFSLEEHQKRWDLLISEDDGDKRSWMEDIFMEAAGKSDDEWGDASHFRHELPLPRRVVDESEEEEFDNDDDDDDGKITYRYDGGSMEEDLDGDEYDEEYPEDSLDDNEGDPSEKGDEYRRKRGIECGLDAEQGQEQKRPEKCPRISH